MIDKQAVVNEFVEAEINFARAQSRLVWEAKAVGMTWDQFLAESERMSVEAKGEPLDESLAGALKLFWDVPGLRV